MKKYQNTIFLFLRLLISFLFLFSAYAKLHPMEMMQGIINFEENQLIPMGFSEKTAPYFSRFIIGAEIFIGLTILFNYYLKRIVLPLAIIMITGFSIHLSTQLGSDAPCGCHGELIKLTPLQSLIKNILTLIILVFMYKKSEVKRGSLSVLIILTLSISTLMFTMFPVGNKTKNQIISQYSSFVKEKDVKINEGDKILCFLEPDCEKCKKAGRSLDSLSRLIDDFPEIHVLFSDGMDPEGVQVRIDDFFEFAGNKFSYEIMPHYIDDDEGFKSCYLGVLGHDYSSPVIIYLQNGNQIRFYQGQDQLKFDPIDLQKILVKEE